MSFLHGAINTLKSNGIGGSFKVFKNHIRTKSFYKKYGDINNIISTDDGFLGYDSYDCEYQNNIDFSDHNSTVKPIAFYLPQFHTIPENDAWWGKDFTEWTNTKKATPKFESHYQPREPHENIGYYNLEDVAVLKSQAELAKSHGIYGFCFYHYWFSGKRLLEKPVDMLLDHPEIDINFMLCWANENWTKAWDGQNSNILIKQDYSKSDPEKFIDDLQKYINDKRYIKIDSKPVILIYNCSEIPNIKKTLLKMRNRAKDIGIGEILIWSCRTHNTTADSLKITDYIDAEVEFPPHNLALDSLRVNSIVTKERSNIYNYQKLVQFVIGKYKQEKTKKPVYKTVMASWDNSCRRKDNYTVYYAFSIKSFYNWIKAAVEDAKAYFCEKERFIFVNAFNEWAEGTYLEPDKKYGYANINALSCALFDLPLIKPAVTLKPINPSNITAPKIAVQAHITDIFALGEIIKQIKLIPFEFDLFVSTDTPQKLQFIKNSFAQKFENINVSVDIFDNCQNDSLPFVLQMKNHYKNYDILCHINSNGIKTHGYLYDNVLGSKEQIAAIVNEFNINSSLGLIFPKTLNTHENKSAWANNRKATEKLLEYLNISSATPSDAIFPLCNMFWAKTNAITNVFDDKLLDQTELYNSLQYSLRFICTYNKYDYLQTLLEN